MSIKRLHPDLYRYDEKHLDPLLLTGDPAKILTEECLQVYTLRVFTPEFCAKLIEETEHHGAWENELAIDMHPPRLDEGEDFQAIPLKEKKYLSKENIKELHAANDEDDQLLNCASFFKMPGLNEPFQQVIMKHINPLANHIWKTFNIQMIRSPYVLKYDPDEPASAEGQRPHWDQAPLQLVVYLNEGFEGGGTHYPRWNKTVGRGAKPGTAALFPGSLSHEHGGLPVTRGDRYVLICIFF